ncbi:hypothetical protein [Sphingomonas sp. PB4P5]|uniref:hypothetical protein n=1 Tax=Parasphingomonas puruogangriensis TaxID=3096155 RepID=UPI002FC854C3
MSAHSVAMRLLAPLIAASVLASCTAVPAPKPVPAPRPLPTYAPPPPKPLSSDWRDWPYTPGDWRYVQEPRGSIASFGPPGAAPAFTIRCDLSVNAVQLARAGMSNQPVAMTIRTSTSLRTLTVQPSGGMLAVSLAPRDGLLEAMGFSRGRFVVEMAGYPTLVLPSWAEIERVTEDCRR